MKLACAGCGGFHFTDEKFSPHLPSPSGLSAEPSVGNGTLLSRRQLLKASAALPLILTGTQSLANVQLERDFWSQPRYVWLKDQASGETIKEFYWADGKLLMNNYQKICWFLRDRRRNEAVYYSTIVLDVMYATAGWLAYFKIPRPITKTSAYRHPITNANIEGAAKNSLHQHGRAIDGTIPGVPVDRTTRFGIWLQAGGIGFYPSRNFTHWDDGNLRTWIG